MSLEWLLSTDESILRVTRLRMFEEMGLARFFKTPGTIGRG